jgi:hypothetical protein
MNKAVKILCIILMLSLIFNFSMVRAEESGEVEEENTEDNSVVIETAEEPAEDESTVTDSPEEAVEGGEEQGDFTESNSDSTEKTEQEMVEMTETSEENEVNPLVNSEHDGSDLIKETEGDNQENTSKATVKDEETVSSEAPVISGDSDQNPASPTSVTIMEDSQKSEAPVIFEPLLSGDSENADTIEILPFVKSMELNEVNTSHQVNLGLIRRPTISKATVIAQWQMAVPDNIKGYGRDDSDEDGAQFLPSGSYQISRTFLVCGLVSGGIGKIESATAIVNYPEDVRYSQTNDNRSCGHDKSIINMSEYEQEEAEEIFCESIRKSNYNLVSWNEDKASGYSYDYNQVCSQEGLLVAGQAQIYCAQTRFFYDDPAGEYQISVSIKNDKGEDNTGYSYLEYMELTMFEADFNDMEYGMVDEKDWKIIFGDTIWGESSAPTVRNVGNTRLSLLIDQNDFGLGYDQGRSEWNITYQARIGEDVAFTSYSPGKPKAINNPLELGQTMAIDLAVFVRRFPEKLPDPYYSGAMTMNIVKEEPLTCKNDL